MKKINYVEYKHSYAHALIGNTNSGKPLMNAIKYAACQKKDFNLTYNLLKKYVFKNPSLIYTEKETEFHEGIKYQCLIDKNPIGAYYYCKNALNKAKSIIVNVDEDGNLI